MTRQSARFHFDEMKSKMETWPLGVGQSHQWIPSCSAGEQFSHSRRFPLLLPFFYLRFESRTDFGDRRLFIPGQVRVC